MFRRREGSPYLSKIRFEVDITQYRNWITPKQQKQVSLLAKQQRLLTNKLSPLRTTPKAAPFSKGGAPEAESEDNNKVGEELETPILKTYDFNSAPGRTTKIVAAHSPDFFKSAKATTKLG